MRIVYHHRTLADGAEGIHIHEMVEAFERLGHHVSMHALASSTTRGIGRPSVWGRLKASVPGLLFELAAVAYNVVDYIRFRRILRRERPDFVYKRHAQFDIGAILAAREQGVPIVLEANCAYSVAESQPFQQLTFKGLCSWCERVAVNGCMCVAAVSTPMAEHLRRLMHHPSRAIVVPNGADPERFHPRPNRGANVRTRFGLGDRTIVGWSGILRDWHRVDLLLEALTELSGCHLLIVGDGPDRSRLDTRAVALGVNDRVHITGRVPHADMPDYIAAFDVAVVAHDGTGFASPMKLLEYMAMGLAVVAPRIRNIEDIVDDGVDGLLFSSGNPLSLATVIRTLIDNPTRCAQLGRSARAKIERERNWITNAQRIVGEVKVRSRNNLG